MIGAHIGGVPVEELAPFAPAAGSALLALLGSRLTAARNARRRTGRTAAAGAGRAAGNGERGEPA